jgi:mannose/fructose-specific phosphotransferase system component IIA
MIHGLVITHGNIGRELVRVVEMILGPVAGLAALSNAGKSVQDLTAEIGDHLSEPEDGAGDRTLLFVDDFGGSCANAAQLAVAGSDGDRILTGVNLAMLLDFATWRESMTAGELARRLVEKGREAVAVLGPGRED